MRRAGKMWKGKRAFQPRRLWLHALSSCGIAKFASNLARRKAMLDLSKDIDSLSNFKRNTAQYVGRMKKTGRPVVLTINGKAELIVQDAASYQRLLDLVDRIESLEFLRQSLEDIDAGRTKPMREAIEALGKARTK
jgi:hypothetical protein